jgi:hypothetical protein
MHVEHVEYVEIDAVLCCDCEVPRASSGSVDPVWTENCGTVVRRASRNVVPADRAPTRSMATPAAWR